MEVDDAFYMSVTMLPCQPDTTDNKHIQPERFKPILRQERRGCIKHSRRSLPVFRLQGRLCAVKSCKAPCSSFPLAFPQQGGREPINKLESRSRSLAGWVSRFHFTWAFYWSEQRKVKDVTRRRRRPSWQLEWKRGMLRGGRP